MKVTVIKIKPVNQRRPCLKNITNNLKKSGIWKNQLTIGMKFIYIKDCVMC